MPPDDAQPVGGDLHVPGAGPLPVGVDHRALVRLVGRLVVAEPDVAVRAEHLRRPELGGELLQQREQRCPDVRVVRGLVLASSRSCCCPPPGPRRRPVPRPGIPRSSPAPPRRPSSSSACQRTSRRGCATGVQRAGPAVRRPSRPTRRTPPTPGRPRAATPAAARRRPARPGRRRRPAAGCRGRAGPSAAPPAGWRPRSSGPAGSGCSAAGQLGRPEGGEAHERVCPRRRPGRRGPGVGGAVTAARQDTVAAASSHSSRTVAGSTARYAVRQVTAWIRAISGASAGRAGRTETSAVPVIRGNGEGSTRAA